MQVSVSNLSLSYALRGNNTIKILLLLMSTAVAPRWLKCVSMDTMAGYNAPRFIIGHEVSVLKAHWNRSEHNGTYAQKKQTFTYITELSHSAQNGFIVPCKKNTHAMIELWLDKRHKENISRYILYMINTITITASCHFKDPGEEKQILYDLLLYKNAPIVWSNHISIYSPDALRTETTRGDDKLIIRLITAGYLLSNEAETYDSGIVKLPVARLPWLTKPWRNRRPDFSPISAEINPSSVSSFCLKGHMFHGTAFWEDNKETVHPNWNLGHFLIPHGVPKHMTHIESEIQKNV